MSAIRRRHDSTFHQTRSAPAHTAARRTPVPPVTTRTVCPCGSTLSRRTVQTFSIYTLAIPFGPNRLEAINIGPRESRPGSQSRQPTLSSSSSPGRSTESLRPRSRPPALFPFPDSPFRPSKSINTYLFDAHRHQLSMTLIPLAEA